MKDELLRHISGQLDALQESVSRLQHDLDDVRKRALAGWSVRSTQQLEYREILLSRLDVDRSWLPPTRGGAASPDFLCVLSRHLLAERPNVTVECGTGVSTLVMGRCFQLMNHGQLFSLEQNASWSNRNRELVAERGLEKYVKILDAPLETMKLRGADYEWYSLDVIPDVEISCLVIDGPRAIEKPFARFPAGPILFSRLTDKAVVFVDDFNRRGERQCFEKWREQYPNLVASIENTEKGCLVLRRDE